jgi:hypothetical protein
VSALTAAVPQLPAMSDEAIARVRLLEARMLEMPQAEIDTSHLFHAGMYARSILIPAGVCLTGVLIKRATVVILSGHASIYTGGEVIELQGYHVMAGAQGRKQVFLAYEDTYLTMIFPTETSTVEAAEDEFTDETSLLMSRRQES